MKSSNEKNLFIIKVSMADQTITVFVSYSHDDESHMQWVRKFVTDLRDGGGFTVLYDQDLEKGASLPRFMENGIANSDKVLVIGTPEYKRKASLSTGAGFEEAIIGTEYLQNIDSTKFYPILRSGSFSTSFPMILAGRNGDDFTDDSLYKTNLKTVIRSIVGNRNVNAPLDVQILDLCSQSETFPKLPSYSSIIDRESEIEQIESLLDEQDEKRVVFVDGQDGVGVTTLLGLLVQRHPNHCISYFNDGFSRFSLSPEIVERSLVRQVYFYIYNTPLPDGMDYELNSLYLKLLHKAKTTPLFFVFDGFDDVPIEYEPGLRSLFEKLPWGIAKFVFAGEQKSFKLFPSSKKTIQTVTANRLLPFSKPRVKDYFHKLDNSLSDSDLEELYDISHGFADKIEVLRSLYLKYKSFTKIIEEKESYSKTIYHAEISRLESAEDELSLILLSVVAFADIHTLEFLQAVLEKTESEVVEILGKNSDIVYIDDNGVVRFRSEALLKYMRGYLDEYQPQIEMRLLSVYESNKALYAESLLPLYKKLHKDQSLIRLLNDENIQEQLDQNRSQASLNIQCDFGYEAAMTDDNYLGDALRFAVLRSTSRQIEQNKLWDYETEALVVQGKIEEAIALTQNIYLKEEQLKSLAIIVKKSKGLSREKKESILLAIRQLALGIQFEKIPEKSLELAPLLLDVDLQLSMEIIEKLVNDERNNISLDNIYAMLSLSLRENYLNDSDATDSSSYEKIQAKIKDSEIRKMTDAMSMLYSDASVDDVLKKAQDLRSDTQRIYFLMFWIPGHKKKAGIEKIVLYALGLVVTNSNIDIPRINIVLGICMALPYFSNIEDVEKAKQMLDSIETDIKTPTFTYIQVKLLLIEALAKFSQEKAFEQLENVYLYVDEFPDKAVSIDCLSLILSSFERLGEKKYLNDNLSTQNELLKHIKQRLSEAFKETAYHFNLIKKPIKFLVVDYQSFLKDMAPLMNTESRRSKAYVYGAWEYIRRCPIDKYKWDYLDSLLANIKYRTFDIEIPVVELARKIKNAKYNDTLLVEVKKRQNLFCGLSDESNRCFVLSQLYVWLYSAKPEDSFAEYILNRLISCWQSIDSIQTRIEVGFHLVTTLNPCNLAIAGEILEKTLAYKQQASFTSSSCLDAMIDAIDLYTRSVGVMIKSGLCDDRVINKFKGELEQLDDVGIRIASWGKITLEYYLVNDVNHFNKYVYEEIILPLEKLNKNNSYYKHILCTVAPSIYLYQEHLYAQFMIGLEEFYVNVCASHTCDFIFYKHPYLSDLEYDKNDIRLTYKEYQQLLSLFSYITFDDDLFVKIDNVCRSLRVTRQDDVSQTQITDIAKSIRAIADKKFPAPMGIAHDGYKVACNIATHELLNRLTVRNLWAEIDTQIQAIDNKTDQAFLYFYSLQYISRKPQQIEFLQKGNAILKHIPVGFDRLTRFDMALEESLKNCKGQVKDLLTAALNSVKFETNDDYNFFERFTDIAYQYEVKFADAYLEMADKDMARRYNRGVIRSHVASQKRINDAENDMTKALTLPSNDYAKYFNKEYSSMVRGKGIAKSPHEFYQLIPSIYERSLTVSKNAVLYFIEDVRHWHEFHHNQEDLILKIYAAMAFNFRMVEALSVNSKASLVRLLHILEDPNSLVVRPGERDKGLDMLYEWYQKNNTSNLKIIDPYFSAKDLLDIKPLFEFNNDLHVSILAHAKNEDSLDNYKDEWERIVSNLHGCIDIMTVSYADKPDNGPLHDRYWFAQDREKGILVGIKTTSLSNMGKKDSNLEDIPEDKTKELYDGLWLFYADRVRQIDGRQLVYKTISI